VVVRDSVAIALPVDEAVDAADAVGDARRVVRVARQRHELVLLVGEALEAGASLPPTGALVDDGVDPFGELAADIVDVVERARVEERPDHFPEAALDARLGVGQAVHRARSELVVGGEGEKARVVDRLRAFPAEHDRLLAVVGAALGGTVEALERAGVAVHQRVQITGREDVEVFSRAVGQDVRKGFESERGAAREPDHEGRPVALGHLAGAVGRRREARLGLLRRPDLADVPFDRGVAALESLAPHDLEDALRGDVRIALEEIRDPPLEAVDLLRARRSRGRRRQCGVRGRALLRVRREYRSDRVSADVERACDRAPRHAVARQRDDLVHQLRARVPSDRHAARSPVTVATVRASAASTGASATRPSRTTEAGAASAPSGVARRRAWRRPAMRSRVATSAAIQSASLRSARVGGRAVARAGPGPASRWRAMKSARASSSCRSRISATKSSVCRTVSPRRMTTAAAARWLPRGNADTGHGGARREEPEPDVGLNRRIERLDEQQTPAYPALVP
jgi:hypothetical protein